MAAFGRSVLPAAMMAGVYSTRSALQRHLDVQREHVLGALDGLTDEQLRQPVLPSGWNCLGLVRHLTISDETYWFACVMGGASMADLPSVRGDDWLVMPDETPASVFRAYRASIARSDEVITSLDVDDPPAQPDPAWAQWGLSFPDLQSVLLYVITETAVHAGHVDAVRELLDGKQWVVLT